MIESLSIQQVRKLVLLSQGLPPCQGRGSGLSATLSVIQNLGYIQIDTISVVQRAHHHTIWNRNPRYKSDHLNQLLRDKNIFEYWSHAAAYLPMAEFKYSLVRKKAIAEGEINHWYDPDKKLMNGILERISREGPLMAKDFAGDGRKSGEWRSKPAKRALECLFMQGDLMVPYRQNFQKVYDLTERVLPEGVDRNAPIPEEYARFLINRYLQANGIGLAKEINYLLKKTKEQLAATLNEMLLGGELIQVDVNNIRYYALPDSLELLKKPLRRSKLKILSPFDNLVIQRDRTRKLFDFNYILECYLPRQKRKHGYFSLPLLWDGRLIGRMDCKAERKNKLLHVNNLVLEENVKRVDELIPALCKELTEFMVFNGCEKVTVHKSSPDHLSELLKRNGELL